MRQIITSLGRYMASSFAFLILFGYGALWFLYKPTSGTPGRLSPLGS